MVVMPLPPCLPSVSSFMISILGCSWLLVPPCLPSFSPFMISLPGCSWAALGCHWPLPPCLPSLSPFMISLLGCCRCHLVSQLVSLHDFPFGLLLAAAATLSPSLFPSMIFLLGCSWLPLPPCLPACLPSSFPFWAALCRCRLVSQACLPSSFPFWAALAWLVSLHGFPSGLLLACFLSQACLPS